MACLACLAIAVSVPVAAAANVDQVAQAPVAPADLAKPVKDASDKLTGGAAQKLKGGGKDGGAGKSHKAGGRGASTPVGASRKVTSKPDGASAPAAPAPTPAAAGPPPAATPVATNPAAPGPAVQAPRASDTASAPVSARTPAGTTALGAGRVFAGGPSGAPASGAADGSSDSAGGTDRARRARPRAPETVTRTVVRSVRRAVEVVPGFLWALIAGLGAFSLLATGASSFLAGRARRLARQREALLQDVGLLQRALLPEAPAQIGGAAAASVAYRAATSGPPGGDFYDVFALDEERLGLIVGRVSATGRRALGLTALIRHMLRAYLEGGLQPRNALQVGAEVLERHLGPDYACATVAVYDRATSRLTYAGAGMPAPIVLGSAAFEPATACAAPPIGMGVATGTRQTTVLLPAGAAACLYTDGLVDARVGGGRYGYRRAWHALEALEPDADADALLDRVAAEADTSVDDIAAVLLRVGRDVPEFALRGERRLEELELGRRELDGERPGLFLRDCGVPTSVIPEAVDDLRETATRLGGAVLRVRYGAGVPEPETGLRTMEILSAVAGPNGG
jgi:hypothetical protein